MLLWSGDGQPDQAEHSGEDPDMLEDAELLLNHVRQFLTEHDRPDYGIQGN